MNTTDSTTPEETPEAQLPTGYVNTRTIDELTPEDYGQFITVTSADAHWVFNGVLIHHTPRPPSVEHPAGSISLFLEGGLTAGCSPEDHFTVYPM